MKPLDPRLLRYARASRGVFGFGAVLGVLRTVAIVAWCWCLAHAIAALALPALAFPDLFGSPDAAGRVAEGDLGAAALPLLLAGGAVAVAVRAGASWGMDVLAARGAIRVKGQLRSRALDALDGRSPEWAARRSDAETATVLGRGLDALDGYFSAYVPQLILTACATPILVLTMLLADPTSGIIVCIVFPVIPVFMVLIGLATQSVQDRQWEQLQRLSTSFLDVIEGLTTLKIFRREDRQRARIERETEEYRRRTVKVLRVTFLSGFVLDLAGTFSIALVAVTVGTRLVAGEFPLALGIFVLLLLPEAFIPIRQVGAAFHASTEGLTAAQRIFDIIERPERAMSVRDAGPSAGIAFADVRVQRAGDIVVGPVTFSVAPGEVVALTGPSGAGKSTLVSALLGFVEIDSGTVLGPPDVAWTGQRPGLLQGTVAENVALGAEPDDALVDRALAAVGLDLDPRRALGVAGTGLSGGQAQRVAVARCLYRAWTRDAGAVVLDEPSSALDRASESRIAAALQAEAHAGRAVLVISHRDALIEAAHRTVSMGVHA
ncbi:hypothetical protein GCM10009847_26560 [Leucobacter tardus]|uniref:Thiol reductant ABC exporter subunit CydD n=1 Tax=Leucobacter tardus TaxID=501483 RepID=A0A939QJD9_9MICO|nr:thiol reductant ABC exporter subunit CydD [Leucobacter tardus]MBO2989839.1 thiol reductant ABC exporter subunit CydD [Leucobacter tardus]